MVRPLRLEYPGASYHIISRGNEKKNIFLEKGDFSIFIKMLNYQSLRCNVILCSYCLMNNHIHLLLKTLEANLSYFMQMLLGAYTMAFNRKYERVGHLFQGRYKSIIVDSDAYLMQLSRYIHLNPCKAKVVKYPENYKWSSMKAFMGYPSAIENLEKELVLSKFNNMHEYRSYVLEGINIEENILGKVVNGCILGTEDFVETIKCRLEDKNINRSRTSRIYGIRLREIERIVRHEEDRIKIYALWKWAKLKQSDIAKRFNRTDAAISYTVRQIEKNRSNKSIRNWISSIEKHLGI